MKIFIELPTWLGDAVMSTPAIENLMNEYPDAELTLAGSYLSVEAIKNNPQIAKYIVLGKKLFSLYRAAGKLGKFDLAVSFRSSPRSKFFLFLLQAGKKCQFPGKYTGMHQVEKYNTFLNDCLGMETIPGPLKLYETPYTYLHPTLGINPGASYGSAKRWYPEAFAKVAVSLAEVYDIVIFGGPGEKEIAADIEADIRKAGVKNVVNLAGKMTIPELVSRIAGLTWFVTNDSGPMHVAAAYQIPTVALFGPTRHKETHQWKNPHEHLIRKEMACAPCMRRTCPLGHHECMKAISAEEVIKVIRNERL